MPDDRVLHIVMLTVLALVVILAALSAILITQRLVASFFARRADRRRVVLVPLLFRALEDRARIADCAIAPSDRAIARDLLLQLAMDLRGEAADAVVALYDHLGLLDADRRGLTAWRWIHRAGAAGRLGVLRASAALPDLLNALTDLEPQVRQVAVWAVGQVGDRAALEGLVPLLGDPNAVVAARTEEILAERGREVQDVILAYAERPVTRGGLLAALQLIGWLRVSAAVPLLLRLMDSTDAEVRVKAVKAGAATGDPRLLEMLHLLLRDSQWEVRCQAAKALSVLGCPASRPHLETALHDSQWWVRFYAATALAEIGPEGETALRNALTDREPRVREMARYLLGRGSLVPVLP